MRIIPVEKHNLIEANYKQTKNYAILKEFVDSGLEIALLEDYPHKNAACAQNCLTISAKRYGFNVKIAARGNRVFIMKMNPDEM